MSNVQYVQVAYMTPQGPQVGAMQVPQNSMQAPYMQPVIGMMPMNGFQQPVAQVQQMQPMQQFVNPAFVNSQFAMAPQVPQMQQMQVGHHAQQQSAVKSLAPMPSSFGQLPADALRAPAELSKKPGFRRNDSSDSGVTLLSDSSAMWSAQSQSEPAAASTAVIKRPCEHNSWESVRMIRKRITIRCRVCQALMKLASPRSVWRCPAFKGVHRKCPNGDACPKIHLYHKKLGLIERLRNMLPEQESESEDEDCAADNLDNFADSIAHMAGIEEEEEQ